MTGSITTTITTTTTTTNSAVGKTPIDQAVLLDDLNNDSFQSKNLWRPNGARGVFGGQVVAQGLMAAFKTIEPSFIVHSLHSYFLLPGDPDIPITYQVNRVRDGKSYCTRTIHATQNGKIIFISEVSFKIPESSILDHQYDPSPVERPDNLPSRDELVKGIINDPEATHEIKNAIKFHIFEPFDLDIRFLENINVRAIREAKPMEPIQRFWIRVSHPLPDDFALHNCIAAYATDHLLLSTSMRPLGLHMWNPRIAFMATLDHCIWFHDEFRVDEWLLYEMESPRATGGRGFSIGRLYDKNGKLVLSCAQEGVIRIKSKQ